jgi:hypothetical protein
MAAAFLSRRAGELLDCPPWCTGARANERASCGKRTAISAAVSGIVFFHVTVLEKVPPGHPVEVLLGAEP